MKRLLTILFIALMAVPSFAQKQTVYDGFDIYNLDSGKKKNKGHFALEAGIGTEFEVTGRFQFNFGKYFALDVLKLGYARDFNDDIYVPSYYGPGYYKDNSWNEFTAQVGVRGFTPSFASGMKGYLNFNIGYGAMFEEIDDEGTHCGAVELGLGMYLYKGLYVGYSLQVLAHDEHSHKDHLFRIGYEF